MVAKIFESTREFNLADKPISLGGSILDALDSHHDKILFVDCNSEKRWTGAQIKETLLTYTTALIDLLGIQPGDVCCISFDNTDITVCLALAIILAGGVVSCAYPLDPYPELVYLARKTEPKFLFCHSKNQKWGTQLNRDIGPPIKVIVMDNEFQPTSGDVLHFDMISNFNYPKKFINLNRIPVEVGDVNNAVAFISLSSGTTGKPKAVPATHASCLHLVPQWKPVTQPTVVACSATLDYVSGRYLVLGAIYTGYTAAIINGFNLEDFVGYIEKYKINAIYLGAASTHSLMTYDQLSNYDISSLQIVAPIGAKVPSMDVFSNFLSEHSNILAVSQHYGTSETGSVSNRKMAPAAVAKDFNNCGTLLPCVRLKIVDPESGCLLGHNQPGLIYVDSPTVIKGYFDASLKNDCADYRFIRTRETFDEDGFYNTGDIGYMNNKEELFIEGRLKEMMTCRENKKVLPQELEEIINEHPLVQEVTVLGIASTKEPGVDCPRAFIVLKSDNSQRERIDCSKQLMDYVNSLVGWEKQLTGGIVIVNEIPTLRSTGKVNKSYLRNLNLTHDVSIYGDQS